jgi:acyl-CoA dehydrogenase
MSSESDLLTGLLIDMLGKNSRLEQAQVREGIDLQAVGVLAAAGLLTLGVPEEWGGSGGGLRDAGEVALRVGEFGVQAPVAESLVASWSVGSALHQVPDGLLTFAAGEAVASGAESNWKASGIFRRVPYARHADSVIGFARADAGLLLIEAPVEQAQVTFGANLAGEPRDDIELTAADVRATPVDERLATEARLRAHLFRALMISGAAARALETTVRYSTERVQFGRSISAFQAVQQQVALAGAEVVAARTAADAALRLADEQGFGPQTTFAVTAAKTRCNQAAGAVADVAHQVHGAIGVTEEYPLHAITTRLWSWREESGRGLELEAALTEAVTEDGQLWSTLAG